VECPVVIAAAMLDAMLPPTDESVAQEAPEPVYDDLICPNSVSMVWVQIPSREEFFFDSPKI
jgi:hypothetical protein